MTLRDVLSAIPREAMVPAGWVLDGLDQYVADVQLNPNSPAASPPLTDPVDLTVAEVAAHFGRGASTVRTWLLRGDLPGAYRLNGRDWRIPRTAIATMQREQAKRHREKKTLTPRSTGATDLSTWRRHLPSARNA